MSFADDIAAASPAESIGRMDLGPDGGSFEDIKSDKPITDWSDVFRQFNLDPDVFEIIGDTVRMTTWQQSKRTESGDRDLVQLYSYRALFRRKLATIDLPALYAEARRRPRQRVKTTPRERATVCVFADPQIGKTGRRGGTPELLERIGEKRDALEGQLRSRRPAVFAFLDAGDGIENFESGGNPMGTNDLSLPKQQDAYAAEVYKFIELGARFAPVLATVVASNHSAWRRGKQNLGIPDDDYGLQCHRRVQERTDAKGIECTWTWPDPYDESVRIDIFGTPVGMAHGNQFGPGQAISWWEKQAFGNQAVAKADILVTGHYHSFGAGVAGINPFTGRERMWLGAPTLDNGSDHFRQTAGRDSDPGLLIFDITEDGFDLQSLVVL